VHLRKHLLTVLAAVLALTGFAGCGSDDEKASRDAPAPPAKETRRSGTTPRDRHGDARDRSEDRSRSEGSPSGDSGERGGRGDAGPPDRRRGGSETEDDSRVAPAE